ncbi:MAG: ferric reductase-like transmembrane domain-containing protein [Actinomycetota bacterium]|nr:ferric reductase-like transmembrane domain-containing protein [Actinomycetota bacterium]
MSDIWNDATRITGIAAWLAVTASVVWGLAIAGKNLSTSVAPAALRRPASAMLHAHRFLATFAVVAAVLHALAVMADDRVTVGVLQLIVPLSHEEPTRVAWGVVAFQLLIAVHVTALAMRFLTRKAWTTIHRLGLAVYVIATYHAVELGHSADNVLFKATALASVHTVLALVVLRVVRRERRRNRIPAGARSGGDD